MIVLVFITMGVAIILTIFEKKTLMMEYSFIVLLILAAFLSSMNALKMLKDETLSYFIYKRDIFRLGWKILLFLIPAFSFHYVYKNSNQNKSEVPLFFQTALVKIENIQSQRFMLAMISGDEKFFSKFLADKKPIPWESDLRGMFPTHIAAHVDSELMLTHLLDLKPGTVNILGAERKSSPLIVAMRSCHLKTASILIKRGADLNLADIDGDTPLIHAAKSNCAGGVMFLIEQGVDVKWKNKENYSASDYLKKQENGLYSYLRSKELIPKHGVRELASEKKLSPASLIKPHE